MIPFKKGQDNILNSSFNLTFQIKGKKTMEEIIRFAAAKWNKQRDIT